MEKKPRIPIFSSLMDSSGFPFRSIDQLAIQSGQFCLFDDPIMCFQPWNKIYKYALHRNHFVKIVRFQRNMDSSDSEQPTSRSSWRDITIRSGKMEEYSEQTRSLCLKKVRNIKILNVDILGSSLS